MPDVKVGVLEGLLDTDTGRRIEGEHLVEKVQSVGVGLREQAGECLLGHERQVAHILPSTRRADTSKRLLAGSAEDVKNLVKLVDVISALEEGSTTQQLGKNTADRPDINCFWSAGRPRKI